MQLPAESASIIREPWRFNDQGQLTSSDDGARRGMTRQLPPDRSTYDLSGGHQRMQRKAENALRDKATALGLTIAPYQNSLTMMVRQLDGGRDQFLSFVSLAAADDDQDAIKFLQVFGELRKQEQAVCSFDMVCTAAGVSPTQLLKTIVGVVFDANVEGANLLAAAAHPTIIAKTIESAKRIDGPHAEIGSADRERLLKHAGFLPMPKGTVITVSASAAAQAGAAAQATSLPTFAADVEGAAVSRQMVQTELASLPAAPIALLGAPTGLDEDPFADLRTPVGARPKATPVIVYDGQSLGVE